MAKPDPEVLALMVCDLVVEDTKTRNKSLINTFSAIVANDLPFRHDRMYVFLQMTGGHGSVPVTVELLDPDREVVLSISGEPKWKDPRHVIDVVFELRGIVFKKAGLHHFEVLAGEAGIATRPFSVVKGKP